ncbi:hypothetical protein VQ056_05445 [Paenibacillus sp. JTLBN-2024]
MLNYEGPNGDLKGGKTILMRNLAHLQKALDERSESKYKEFSAGFDDWAAFNTEMAWSHWNPDHIVDGNWAGQLLSGNVRILVFGRGRRSAERDQTDGCGAPLRR